MNILNRLFLRGVKYGLVGFFTFTLDLAILYILVNYTSISYQIAIVIGFVVGLSINYHFSYKWVFKGTKRHVLLGYAYFLLIAVLTTIFIVFFTSLLVESFAVPVMLARISIGTIAGVFNFLLNTFLNFRII